MSSKADNNSISTASLATPGPLEEDDAARAAPPCGTFAEMMYVAQGRSSLKALELLSLRVKNDDGTPIFDPLVLPWSTAAHPSSLKWTAKELRSEINRRSVATENVLNAPRPSQWPVKKTTDWFIDNPIVADDDVAFIKTTISHHVSVAEHVGLQAGVPSQSSSNSGGGNWAGKYPYLHLIHAIIDDNDIKTSKPRTNAGSMFPVVEW